MQSKAAGHHGAGPTGKKRPRVVIVGAGFGGLWAAKTLARSPLEVLVVDRNNYHTFLPLLYQVAAAELQPEQIAYPVRGIFRSSPNIDFLMSEVRGVDLRNRILHADGPAISYDYLILAMGTVTGFFGVPGAAEHAYRLKNLEQGIALRNHILDCFERAASEAEPERRQRLLTFTIVGGGPTGVEYCGALAELIRGPLRKDFHARLVNQARIILIEALDNVLPGFPENLRSYARGRLARYGIEVLLNTRVTEVAADRLVHGGETALATETVLWTAGVTGHPRYPDWGLPTSPQGRIPVGDTLQLHEHQEVFVAGDLSYIEGGGSLPLIAPVAVQQGRAAAENILAMEAGRSPRPFIYRDKGSMATIGRGAAVVRLGKYTFSGFSAWILWLFVHLLYLIGFRNRLIVFIHWSFNYFLFERAVRLILPKQLFWIRRVHKPEE
jgi:NADH:ubiquinone reductase (H+-translocating)